MQNGSTEGMGRLTLSLSTRTLRKLYPNHSVVPFMEGSVNLMGYPGALVQPVQPSELVTSTFFAPVARRAGKGGGILLDSLYFGAFSVAYDVSLAPGASPNVHLTGDLEIRLHPVYDAGTQNIASGLCSFFPHCRHSILYHTGKRSKASSSTPAPRTTPGRLS